MYGLRPTRQEILRRYRDCATKLGRVPGEETFCKMSGISRHHIYHYWPRISDLTLEACGARNQFNAAVPEAKLFADYARICLHLKKIPGRNELLITARELGMRLGGVSDRFGTLAAFDLRFRDWLLESSGEESACGLGNAELRAILSFPGWQRPAGPKPAPPCPPAKWPREFLPIGLQYLDELAQGEVPPDTVSDEPACTLFERGCANAFSALGFDGLQSAPAQTDAAQIHEARPGAPGLWIARPEDYGVILQTKLRRRGEALHANNQAFPDFIAKLAVQLEQDGIGKSYLALVSSEFDAGDLKQLTHALAGSRTRGLTLFFASALMRIVEESIQNRCRFHLGEFEKTLFGNRIVSA